MSYDPCLAADHDPVADLGAAADPRLSGDHSIVADFYIMRDLDQVVQLGAFTDKGRPDRRPVDRYIGADLHPILDQYIPDLRDLLKAPIRLWGKAKTIAADHRTRMDRDVGADHAIVIDLHPRMEHGIVTDPDIICPDRPEGGS